MKKVQILICILLLVFNIAKGQIEEDMQIVRERHERAYPSIVKDSSNLNKQSEIAGYKLCNIEPSLCKSTSKTINERVVRKEYRNDTLVIEIAVKANCCSSFLGEIQIKNDSVLNLIFDEYGDECFCHCCFHLTYYIVTKTNNINTFELNGKIIIESDIEFIEVKDSIHKEELYYKNGNLKNKIYTLNNDTIGKTFYDTNGVFIRSEVYKNGQIRKEIKK